MAKNDKVKADDSQEVTSDNSQVSSSVVESPVMAGEIASLQPAAGLQATDAVLSPGRELKPAHQGVVGLIEDFVNRAESTGNHAFAACAHQLLMHLGEMRMKIKEFEKSAEGELKALLNKVTNIFESK